jgi:hypothetical protein
MTARSFADPRRDGSLHCLLQISRNAISRPTTYTQDDELCWLER